jgi:hypothetical protein
LKRHCGSLAKIGNWLVLDAKRAAPCGLCTGERCRVLLCVSAQSEPPTLATIQLTYGRSENVVTIAGAQVPALQGRRLVS